VERRSGVVARRIDLHRRDYKNVVKMTFAKGRSEGSIGPLQLESEGNKACHRFHDGETIDEEALRTLIRSAVT